jgi:hypothetical protein
MKKKKNDGSKEGLTEQRTGESEMRGRGKDVSSIITNKCKTYSSIP